MSGATLLQFKELLNIVQYTLQTKNRGLKFEPDHQITTWKMVPVTSSHYAGDVETRKSVSGWVIYVMEALISWKYRSKKCTTKSSTEV